MTFSHEDMTVFLGPPGTGKTTTLLNVVDEEFSTRKTEPGQLGFVSFTKRATLEAQERSKEKFGMEPRDLPWFRTIHSLAFRASGVRRDEVMQREHYNDFGQFVGYPISAHIDFEEGQLAAGIELGDRMLFCDSLARNRRIPISQQWAELNERDIPWNIQEKFSKALLDYKRAYGLIDFTDMLETFLTSGTRPKLDAFVIDEAQDLSNLQWLVVQEVAKNAKRVYVAGDDDQAIYRWAGADVEQFLSLGGKHQVLSQSHRLPRLIYQQAKKIIHQIKHRYDKTFSPRDEEGCIKHHYDVEDVSMAEGTWLVLARNGRMLQQMRTFCKDQGYIFQSRDESRRYHELVHAIILWENLRKGKTLVDSQIKIIFDLMTVTRGVARGFKSLPRIRMGQQYSMEDLVHDHGLLTTAIWHEALDKIPRDEVAYMIRVLKRGEKLTATPRIRLSTIHGAKGAEADNVMLFTDVSWKSHVDRQRNPDDEHRVFYVGTTRAKQNLHVIMPRTRLFYEVA